MNEDFTNNGAENPPLGILYKYRAWDKSAIEILTLNKIWFASAKDFNDPFDCRVNFDMNPSNEEKRKYIRGLLERRCNDFTSAERKVVEDQWVCENRLNKDCFLKLQNDLQKEIDAKGVLCLSGEPRSLLMWSHYANGHRGVCIGFDGSCTNEFFGKALKVTYPDSDDRPPVKLNDGSWEQTDKILFTKAHSWRYEKEWRIFDKDCPPGKQIFPASALKEVIIGCAMTDEDKQDLIQLAAKRNPRPNLFQAKVVHNKFKLDLIPIKYDSI